VRWIRDAGFPIPGPDGRVRRAAGLARDVTEEKLAAERQELLINELNHRVKNTLATVQSLAAQTLRTSDGNLAARQAFEARLIAVSKAHDVLTRENWEGASLGDIAAQVLAAYRDAAPDHLTIEGPPVRLAPRSALALAMALHELATNAAKYGALSTKAGRVRLSWRVEGGPSGEGGRTLQVRWAEEDGPPVSPPARKGFGSRLMERNLAADLDGAVTLDFAASGVVCTIEMPLADGPADVLPVTGRLRDTRDRLAATA
jgi:two-component sensor histidine kinase